MECGFTLIAALYEKAQGPESDVQAYGTSEQRIMCNLLAEGIKGGLTVYSLHIRPPYFPSVDGEGVNIVSFACMHVCMVHQCDSNMSRFGRLQTRVVVSTSAGRSRTSELV